MRGVVIVLRGVHHGRDVHVGAVVVVLRATLRDAVLPRDLRLLLDWRHLRSLWLLLRRASAARFLWLLFTLRRRIFLFCDDGEVRLFGRALAYARGP